MFALCVLVRSLCLPQIYAKYRSTDYRPDGHWRRLCHDSHRPVRYSLSCSCCMQVTSNHFFPSISSILNSHYLLDLYDTTARLHRGGASTSSLSLTPSNLNFVNPESADFSEFLAPFAGPLQHSALLELDEGPELSHGEGSRGR